MAGIALLIIGIALVAIGKYKNKHNSNYSSKKYAEKIAKEILENNKE